MTVTFMALATAMLAETVERVLVRHVSAERVVQKVSLTKNSKATLTADPATNCVIVIGERKDVEAAKVQIAAIDVPPRRLYLESLTLMGAGAKPWRWDGEWGAFAARDSLDARSGVRWTLEPSLRKDGQIAMDVRLTQDERSASFTATFVSGTTVVFNGNEAYLTRRPVDVALFGQTPSDAKPIKVTGNLAEAKLAFRLSDIGSGSRRS